MKLGKCSTLISTSVLAANMALAETAKEAWSSLVGTEFMRKTEFAFVENNPALPNVLIYGDSISIGYTQRVRDKLQGKANVYRIHKNGGDTARLIPAMKQMHDSMAEHWPFKWDVIHFNAGLHDLKYLTKDGKLDTMSGTQIRSPEDYAAKLRECIAYLQEIAPDASLIFATTTPVPEGAKGRKAGDAARFNAAALDVIKDYPGITINDLYAFTMPHHADWQAGPGDVHYNGAGKKAQGDEVARVIYSMLLKREKATSGN